MMRMLIWWLAGAVAAQAGWTGDFLLPPADAAFVLAWQAPPVAPVAIREWVPRGESEQRWTRMVTVQQWPVRPGLAPAAVMERLAASFGPACPGAVAQSVVAAPLGANAGASVRVDCPRNPETGLPETMWARAVAVGGRIQMVQAATRHVPGPADDRWARGVLAGVTLCGQGGRCAAARDARVGGAL